ncbi:hypothetical protein [Streptomyces sp. ISL-99]|uniref:hypothetical protein n=1 Tax=Streptomyces sp. ISL-99 TaxID=2819193 RepID=UPI001BEBD4C9|nr:hypothetical protein [Streptomyces sp. ISL-99]
MFEQALRIWPKHHTSVDLPLAGEPELFNEAELRHWKSHMTAVVLLEFTDGAMKRNISSWRSAAQERP